MMDKSSIRDEMRARRKALTPEDHARASRIICDKIISDDDLCCALDPFDGWGILAVYLASPDEIDLTEAINWMLEYGATVVAPRWNGETYELAKLKSLSPEDLRKGPMGILEPKDADIVSPKDVEIWLVPGLAFTRGGKRLGYGGGWYDRLLSASRKKSWRYGIACSFQIVDDLPSEPHDIGLTGVIDDSLDHPRIEYIETPSGCRALVSVANRGRWWTAFFGGLAGVGIFPLILWGARCLADGLLPLAGGIVLLVLGAICVLAGIVSLLCALGGPDEAELELNGSSGICRRRWLGMGPWMTRRFEWRPWTRFSGGGYVMDNAPGLSLLTLSEGTKSRPLFRTDSSVTGLLAIRLNHSRVIDAEHVRKEQEKLLSKLPRGLSVTRADDCVEVSVYAPSLSCFWNYVPAGTAILLLALLLSSLLACWSMLMFTVMVFLALIYVLAAVYFLVRGLFVHYRLTIRDGEYEYVTRFFSREHREIFTAAKCVSCHQTDSGIWIGDSEGAWHSAFECLPKRYYLYLIQLIEYGLKKAGQ